jgi:hypothetical protein
MSETSPDDLTADELYTLLTENPDQEEFTPEDLDAVKEDA